MSDIGRYIAKYRKAKGLTQEQLGAKLNVTRQTVSSRWVNDYKNYGASIFEDKRFKHN